MRSLPLHSGARGLEDDCAVLDIGSETLVITHDALAEGTHFLPGADPADIAWKLVVVNLSDLAAKGVEPVGILLGYSLGDGDERFLEGLREVTGKYNVPLLGGDTIRANGPRTLGLTAIGRATNTPVPSRGGAKAGDAIFVTGMLGCALLGFDGDPDFASAYHRPIPLLSEGQALAPHVTAMMDVSDGLLLDCWRMANASSTTFALVSDAIPVADAARFDDCIRWGDDYQLLFTAPDGYQPTVSATCIGTVQVSENPALIIDGEALDPAQGLGYQH